MTTLAITGGIGSGKSAVAAILSSEGIPVYDSDSAAKSLYDRNQELVGKLEESLGVPLRDTEGRFDRRLLASALFSDPDRRSVVESIVHPLVKEDFLRWRDDQKAPVVAIESAIIGRVPSMADIPDVTVRVEAPEDERIRRVSRRSGLSPDEVRARIAAQPSDTAVPDAVIVNDSTEEVLRQRTIKLLKKLRIMKTDLAKTLSVSGHGGLYRYIAQARGGVIAESLETGARTFFDAHSRITTLEDISIYTEEGEVKLKEVLRKLHEVLGEDKAPSSKDSADAVKALFQKALPDYDDTRFYVSHMKKVVDWYNCLATFASLDFVDEEEGDEAPAADEQ